MRRGGQFLIRHAVGAACAAIALLPLPLITAQVSWQLSRLLSVSGGMRIYSGGWDWSEWELLIGTIALAGLLCMGAEALRRKRPWLAWVFPPAMGLLFGLAAGVASTGGEMPRYAPVVIGVTFGVTVLFVISSYWIGLLASGRLLRRL